MDDAVTKTDIEFAEAIVDRHGKLVCKGCIAVMAAARYDPLRRRLAAAERSLGVIFSEQYGLEGDELAETVNLSIDISLGAIKKEEQERHA